MLFVFSLIMVIGGFSVLVYALTSLWLGRTAELLAIAVMLMVAGGVVLIVSLSLIKSSSYQPYTHITYLDEFDEEDEYEEEEEEPKIS